MSAIEDKLKKVIEGQIGIVERDGDYSILSTSDHSNSDRDIWNHRQDIIDAIRKRGYNVSATSKWGVLDIVTTKKISL